MAKDRNSMFIKHLQDHTFTVTSDECYERDYKIYPVVVNYFNVDIRHIENTSLAIRNLDGNCTLKILKSFFRT